MVAKYRPNWQLHGARACMRVWSLQESSQIAIQISAMGEQPLTPPPHKKLWRGDFLTTLLCFIGSSRGSFLTGNIDLRVFLFCRDHRRECFILLAASLFSLVDQPAAPDEYGEVGYMLPRGQSSPAPPWQDNDRDPRLLKKALNPIHCGS